MTDLIRRMDAIQACQVGPSDEWARATKDGYNQAATDCQRNILRIEPAPNAGAVKVKPLVWEIVPTGYGPETYQASAATGFYQVFTDEDSSSGAVFAEFATDERQFGMIYARSISRVNGFIEAKAAAQADYATRILAAIDPTPDPRDAVIARLVEAVGALGAMPEGYCFCSAHRIGDDSKVHEPECADLRAALAAAKEVMK